MKVLCFCPTIKIFIYWSLVFSRDLLENFTNVSLVKILTFYFSIYERSFTLVFTFLSLLSSPLFLETSLDFHRNFFSSFFYLPFFNNLFITFALKSLGYLYEMSNFHRWLVSRIPHPLHLSICRVSPCNDTLRFASLIKWTRKLLGNSYIRSKRIV